MRVHFQERPWDLYVVVGYTLVIAMVLLILNAGNSFAIPLVLLAPGYLLVATIFPGSRSSGHSEIDWIRRIVLSFGLSIVVVPLLVLVLNLTSTGIRFAPTVAEVALFTVAVGFVAYRRRMRLPANQRLSATLDFALPTWKGRDGPDRILTVALATCVAFAGGTLTYTLLVPRVGERFTEFYILGSGGNATAYPTTLNMSEPGTVVVGVSNHEAVTVSYTIRVELVGVRIIYNATLSRNETVEVNQTTLSWINFTRTDGQNWTQSYTFSIPLAGLWKLEFRLYKDAVLTKQELHLFIQVR